VYEQTETRDDIISSIRPCFPKEMGGKRTEIQEEVEAGTSCLKEYKGGKSVANVLLRTGWKEEFREQTILRIAGIKGGRMTC